MRVFPVAHGLLAFESIVQAKREALRRCWRDEFMIGGKPFELRRDFAVVPRSLRKSFAREIERVDKT